MHALLVFFGAAALTVVIEVPVLWLAGYRARRFILVCVLVNIATNLTLNLCLNLGGNYSWPVLLASEVAVVLVEWAVLRLVARGGDPVPWVGRAAARLFGFVLLANATSVAVGLLFWH